MAAWLREGLWACRAIALRRGPPVPVGTTVRQLSRGASSVGQRVAQVVTAAFGFSSVENRTLTQN
jgi:hypothetical protein